VIQTARGIGPSTFSSSRHIQATVTSGSVNPRNITNLICSTSYLSYHHNHNNNSLICVYISNKTTLSVSIDTKSLFVRITERTGKYACGEKNKMRESESDRMGKMTHKCSAFSLVANAFHKLIRLFFMPHLATAAGKDTPTPFSPYLELKLAS